MNNEIIKSNQSRCIAARTRSTWRGGQFIGGECSWTLTVHEVLNALASSRNSMQPTEFHVHSTLSLRVKHVYRLVFVVYKTI